MSKWIKVSDRQPPKDKPFFAYSYGEIIKIEWKERVDRKGWYGFDCPCACCSGHCTADFDFWMPLIKGPKDE